jgi:aldehyde:ferredoxin oxidoreductase
VLKEEGYQKLLSGYYAARGWDEKTGIPTDEKLKELGLDFAISEMKKARGKK